jgi:bifunctional DNA-binding transcriptional regulator/antitoxin component of YhaV-PrlF toxin-antitoxin module
VEVTTIQIRQRGMITLPAKLRRRHSLEAGDTLTLIDLDGTFLVAPELSPVTKLAAEIERLRQEAGLSVEDLLEGLDEKQRRYYRKRKCTSA